MQIITNLISNAKHSLVASDARIRRISIDIEEYPGDRVQIEISDNGQGIASEIKERIFEYGFTTRESGS